MKGIKVLLKIIVSFLAEAATPLTQPNPVAVYSFPELQSFAFLFSLCPFRAQVYGSTPESVAVAEWEQDGVYVGVGRVCVCPPRFQPRREQIQPLALSPFALGGRCARRLLGCLLP